MPTPKRTLKSDIDQLSEDLSHLAEDVREGAEHLAEDVVAAEFLAATDLADSIGGSMEFATRVSELWQHQWQLAGEDLEQLRTEMAANPGAAMAAVLAYWARRAQHQSEGMMALMSSGFQEHQRFMDAQKSIWSPLGKMVREDLRGG